MSLPVNEPSDSIDTVTVTNPSEKDQVSFSKDRSESRSYIVGSYSSKKEPLPSLSSLKDPATNDLLSNVPCNETSSKAAPFCSYAVTSPEKLESVVLMFPS